jgi:hypothetical protein
MFLVAQFHVRADCKPVFKRAGTGAAALPPRKVGDLKPQSFRASRDPRRHCRPSRAEKRQIDMAWSNFVVMRKPPLAARWTGIACRSNDSEATSPQTGSVSTGSFRR